MRLDGAVALVTGSTSGLGEAIAHRFADEGARGILVTGRDTTRGDAVAQEIAAKSVDVEFVAADLTQPSAAGMLMDAVEKRFGRIDVLVNAAGLSTRGSIVDTPREVFDTLMAVNVRAPFYLMQRTVRLMRSTGTAGSIVNIGSVAAYGSLPFLSAYATSKGALMALTKNVAFALQRDRIRVNQLNIGWMNTPTEHRIQTEIHGQPDNWLEVAAASLPFGRLLEPSEVAAAVVWLAGPESGMMTGSIIDFDQSVVGGGLQPMIDPADVPT